MIEWMMTAEGWAAFAALTAMEIVLGVDNIVFLSVLVSRLPKDQAEKARKFGLFLALILRILLLFSITWLLSLKNPVFELSGKIFSWKDIILLVGGGFLIIKAAHEMHNELEVTEGPEKSAPKTNAFFMAIAQIAVIDLVFSIDSIITAIGMVRDVNVMIAAVLVSMAVMYFASGPVAAFVAKHPTVKMLALSFLIMIGAVLVAEGVGMHIPKSVVYTAMAFSLSVEFLNILAAERRRKRQSTNANPNNTTKH